MGLISWLQGKDRQGGGQGIAVNALTNAIYKNFFEPQLNDQQGAAVHQQALNAIKSRKGALVSAIQASPTVAPPTQPPPTVTPTLVTDPYAQYLGLRQFHNKANQPIDSALARIVIDIASKHAIEPKLAGALAIQESNWNPNAIGGTKPPGYGLYQLTPGATGNENRWDQSKLTDPSYNADQALGMIQSYLDEAHKLGFQGTKAFRHALRRYNGGPQYYLNTPGWGGNTRAQNSATYADAVLSYYNQ